MQAIRVFDLLRLLHRLKDYSRHLLRPAYMLSAAMPIGRTTYLSLDLRQHGCVAAGNCGELLRGLRDRSFQARGVPREAFDARPKHFGAARVSSQGGEKRLLVQFRRVSAHRLARAPRFLSCGHVSAGGHTSRTDSRRKSRHFCDQSWS